VEHSDKPYGIKPRGWVHGHAPGAMLGVLAVSLVLGLTGCAGQSGPFSMFHGMAAKPPAPAPGLAAPFPHLSSVPAKPATLSAADQQQIRAQLEAANKAALAALAPAQAAPSGSAALPIHQAPMHQAPMHQAPMHQALAQAAPLLIGFAPGSAIIGHKQRVLLRNLAQRRGTAPAMLAAGFAPAGDAPGLRLALHRALAIADQLTDAGLPLADIRLAALTAGHGGFAALVYDALPPPQATPASVAKPIKHHPEDHS
jgi:hypothetical protein